MGLAATGLFRARWMAAIHDEWIRNVLQNRPDLKPEKLERTRQFMDDAIDDCLVSGYEPLIEGLHLPDPDDRHVLAAAIHAHADTIVTFNLRDFLEAALAPFGVHALHPDDFVLDVFDLDKPAALRAVRDQRARLRNPPCTAERFLDTLERQELAGTVAHLRRYVSLI